MTKAKDGHLEKLRETLQLVGVDRELPEIISHGYSEEDIKQTHQATNNLIQESMEKDSLGVCIHITGEMRALTDPFHRYICEEITQRGRGIFHIVYNLPEELMGNMASLLKWNLENWAHGRPGRLWHEELRTIYSIANRSVNLYALDTSKEIQFSVFGHRYVLLQERHDNKVSNKHTWLLESEFINSVLTDRATALIGESRDVDEGIYRNFTRRINGVSSQRILDLLKTADFRSIERLLVDRVVTDFTESPQEIVDALHVMGFLERTDSGLVQITDSGRRFSER